MKQYELTERGERPDDFLVGIYKSKKSAIVAAKKHAAKTGRVLHVWFRAKPWEKRQRIVEVKA